MIELFRNQLLDLKYSHIPGIYKITNIVNNKVYIGSAKNLYKRVYTHFLELTWEKHINNHLQNAYVKYKAKSFISEVIEYFPDGIDLKKLRDLETYYIQLYKSTNEDYGYNIVSVGRGTSTIDFTPERCKKISDSNKGRTPPNKGKKMSEEQKIKLRKINSDKSGKSIVIYDRIGNIINELPSIRETARYIFNNYDKYHNKNLRLIIKDICNGKISYYYDFIFRYKNNINTFNREYFINKLGTNISFSGPFYFLVTNLLNNEQQIFLTKTHVEQFLGLCWKNKKFTKAFKQLLLNENNEYIVNNYSVKFIYALSDSDVANAVRQSGIVPEVCKIRKQANGGT